MSMFNQLRPGKVSRVTLRTTIGASGWGITNIWLNNVRHGVATVIVHCVFALLIFNRRYYHEFLTYKNARKYYPRIPTTRTQIDCHCPHHENLPNHRCCRGCYTNRGVRRLYLLYVSSQPSVILIFYLTLSLFSAYRKTPRIEYTEVNAEIERAYAFNPNPPV